MRGGGEKRAFRGMGGYKEACIVVLECRCSNSVIRYKPLLRVFFLVYLVKEGIGSVLNSAFRSGACVCLWTFGVAVHGVDLEWFFLEEVKANS